MICDRCRNALQGVASIDESWAVGLKHRPEEDVSDERVRMSYGIKHHPTYESFREALAQRCSVCIALWEGLEPEEQGIFENTTRVGGGTAFSSPGLGGKSKQAAHWINVRLPSNLWKTRVLVLEPLDGEVSSRYGGKPRRADQTAKLLTTDRS